MKSMEKYNVTVELIEDTHIGSGSGRSITVDAMCIRDREGYPVIPASFLKGVVRDHYEDDDISAVFGASEASQGSAIFSSLYCNAKKNRKAHDCFIIHSSTSINDKGVGEKNTFRMIEFIKAGITFTGILVVSAESALSTANAISRISAIGNSKTRGYGRVKFSIEKSIHEPETSTSSVPEGSLGISLVLSNLDPVCLPSSTVKHNMIFTEDFLRGQRIKGALYHYLDTREVEKMEIADIIFSSMTLCSNGYPSTHENVKDVYPFPLNLKKHKYLYDNFDTEEIFSLEDEVQPFWSVPTPSITYTCEDSVKPLKRPGSREYLVVENDDCCYAINPAIRVHMKNHILRNGKNHKTELFSEEEIEEGSCFPVEIFFKSTKDLQRFSSFFSSFLNGQDYLRIGRGGRPFECRKYKYTKPENSERNLMKEKPYYLYFISDTILRDRFNNFIQHIDASVLKKILNVPDQNKVHIEQTTFDTERITGFNRASEFMIAPKIGIRRGSCVKFYLEERINLKEIQKTEGYEVGYGQIQILEHMPEIRTRPITKTKSIAKIDNRKDIKTVFQDYIDGLGEEEKYSLNQFKMLKTKIRTAKITGELDMDSVFFNGQLGDKIRYSFDIDLFYLALRKFLADKKE